MISRLDDNYLFLLQFVEQPMKRLSQEQQSVANKWLVKLGTDSEVQSIGAKVKRNSYLSELIHQMEDGTLNAPFNAQPKQGDLTVLDMEKTWLVDETEQPEWLTKLKNEEDNKVHVGGKNFETYLSSRMFPNGRGACSYLAVSVQNEGEGAAWVRVRPNQRMEERIDQVLRKEMQDL